jgi:hypothetical protein
VPLNSEAMNTILDLGTRAKALGGANMNDYVFPACENGKMDHTKPQRTWRTAWRRLTQAIYCSACGRENKPGTYKLTGLENRHSHRYSAVTSI